MCALSGLIVAFGLSLSDCPEATQPGFNDMTGTDAKAITLSKRRNGYEITNDRAFKPMLMAKFKQ